MASSLKESVLSGALQPAEPSAGGTGTPSGLGKEPLAQNVAVLVSVIVHALAMLFIGLSALLAPHRPSAVPVFELVNLEKPKLRPLTPKTVKPPDPKPPEPTRPPDPPKLTPKPTKAVQPKKPEPKVVKERPPDEEPKPVKEVVQEQQVLTPQIVSHVPSDPRLSFWASRVKKSAELLWRPPTGIGIAGTVKAVIAFTVIREGKIQDVQVATSSGNSDLDDLARETILRLDHTPPIPPNYPEEQIQVSYEFVYSGQL